MQFAKIAFITARIIASIDCSDCWRYVALYWDFTVPGSESRFVSICPLQKAALRINWTVIVFAYIARRTRPNIVIRTLLTMLDTHITLLETRHSPPPPFWVETAPTRFNICCSPEFFRLLYAIAEIAIITARIIALLDLLYVGENVWSKSKYSSNQKLCWQTSSNMHATRYNIVDPTNVYDNREVKHDFYGQRETGDGRLLLIKKSVKTRFNLSRSFEKLLDIWS